MLFVKLIVWLIWGYISIVLPLFKTYSLRVLLILNSLAIDFLVAAAPLLNTDCVPGNTFRNDESTRGGSKNELGFIIQPPTSANAIPTMAHKTQPHGLLPSSCNKFCVSASTNKYYYFPHWMKGNCNLLAVDQERSGFNSAGGDFVSVFNKEHPQVREKWINLSHSLFIKG